MHSIFTIFLQNFENFLVHSAKDIEKSQNEYESKRPIAASRKQITFCTERSLSMGWTKVLKASTIVERGSILSLYAYAFALFFLKCDSIRNMTHPSTLGVSMQLYQRLTAPMCQGQLDSFLEMLWGYLCIWALVCLSCETRLQAHCIVYRSCFFFL